MSLEVSKLAEHRENARNSKTETMELLRDLRRSQLKLFYPEGSQEVERLEQLYGKYLYLPFDIPTIKFNDLSKFKDWWKIHNQPITKSKDDLSGNGPKGYTNWDAVDIINEGESTWTKHLVPEFDIEFPEIKQQVLEYFPIKHLAGLVIWSNNKSIPEHRDHAAALDLPISFRVLLEDENPDSTMEVCENPLNPFEYNEYFRLPRLPDTNSFGWNNVRTIHRSSFDPVHRKWLMILHCSVKEKEFADLMERSIGKYQQHAKVSNLSFENFFDCENPN